MMKSTRRLPVYFTIKHDGHRLASMVAITRRVMNAKGCFLRPATFFAKPKGWESRIRCDSATDVAEAFSRG